MNGDLRENCRLLDEKLHRAVNPDMHVRFFRTFLRDAAVYYVDGLISTDFMQHYLLSPLQNAAETASSGEIAGCIRQRVALCEVEAFLMCGKSSRSWCRVTRSYWRTVWTAR